MLQLTQSSVTRRARRKGKKMSLHRIQSFVLAIACLILAGQALAQNTPAPNAPAPSAPLQATAAPDVPPPPDADETFLTGLRRVGVMAGQVVECSADADKQAKIAQAMELANKIAVHFGLKAAFNYVGAVGYGSGHSFDKADCARSVEGWKEIQVKYLSK
jgi:hypothetical protein